MTTDTISRPNIKIDIADKLNRPLRDLRISVIDRCNFRCNYCMPKNIYTENYDFLKSDQWLTFDEIVRIVRLFANVGMEKLRITGGEPLLRPNLSKLIERLSNIEEIKDLALTTNGALLGKYAHTLQKAGLHRLTVSLDTLDYHVFEKINGGTGKLNQVLEGIKIAENVGFDEIKINVVIQKNVNDDSILDLVEYFRNSGHIIRFIEYMDVGTCNHWDYKNVVTSKEIYNIINQVFPLEPLDKNYFGEVANRYRFTDGSGEVGFISSVSQPFCQSCTRARLSADGKLFKCLFSSNGEDLRHFLRSNSNDNEIHSIISEIWKSRNDRYSEERNIHTNTKQLNSRVEMFQIGG